MTALVPRPYQLEAKRAVYRAFKSGARSVLVVAATGTGKGAIIGMMAADAVAQGKRVLVFVHRKEIVDQLAGHVRLWAKVEPAIEQAERREAKLDSPVVVGSVASLVTRLDRFPPDSFDLLIADEAAHALADTWTRLFDHFAKARIVGLTATPNRGDERALGQRFDELAFNMPLPEAIRLGWLVPLRTLSINLPELDLSGVRRRHGDLVAGELGAVMSEVSVLRSAAKHSIDIAADKQAIVFCVTVPHMHAMVEAIRQVAEERRLELPIASVDGGTPPSVRDQIFADFRAKKIRWLANVEVATEGFDAPDIEAVIKLRPTYSRALHVQTIGRGARPLAGTIDGIAAAEMAVRLDELLATGKLAASGDGNSWVERSILDIYRGDDAAARRLAIAMSDKPECIVIDFTGDSGKHDLADEMDALGGDYTEPEQREARRIMEAGGAQHLLEALERSRAERAAKLRETRARAGDPFALFDIPFRSDPYGRQLTQKHRRVLDPLKLPLGQIGWRQANDLCNELARRERLDLSMYEQARLLARLGCPVAWMADMTRREASGMIELLTRDGWQRPRDWAGIRAEVARFARGHAGSQQA